MELALQILHWTAFGVGATALAIVVVLLAFTGLAHLGFFDDGDVHLPNGGVRPRDY